MHEALILLGLLAALVVGIVSFASLSIRQMGQARLLEPAGKEAHAAAHRFASLHGLWASHFRFEWVGGFRFRGLDRRFVAAWRHAEQPVFLQVQLIKGATHYELLSVFNREQTLTTTSMNALVPPSPPGCFVQRYPEASLTDLFLQHTAAHDFLVAAGHVVLEPHAVRFDRATIDVMARTHAFVTSLPAWPLRTVAWVLFGPRRARNRGVPEQLAFVAAPSDAAAEPAAAPVPPGAAKKKAAAPEPPPVSDDPEAPLDGDTAAQVEALLSKAGGGAQRGASAARARRPTPSGRPAAPAARELGPQGPAGRPAPGGPAPRAGRTR